MKRLELGIIDWKGKPTPISEFLTEALEVIPEKGKDGVDFSSMLKRSRVIDALLPAKDAAYVDLEDADFDFMKTIFELLSINRFSRDVLLVGERIANAKAPPKAAE